MRFPWQAARRAEHSLGVVHGKTSVPPLADQHLVCDDTYLHERLQCAALEQAHRTHAQGRVQGTSHEIDVAPATQHSCTASCFVPQAQGCI
jgi:hypothetical protein